MSRKHSWELVSSQSYFRRVLGNFIALGFGPAKDGQAKVRFGETGIGHSPHYQVTDDFGVAICYNGQNHKLDQSVAKVFANSNLSQRSFSYSEIQTLLSGCTA